jgi:hypothetical protein
MKDVVSRRFTCAALGVALIAVVRPGIAGSYLDRAALLIREAREEADVLSTRLGDRELARVVQRLCEGRVAAADEMLVPKEVKLAHPHLILMLERYERAADAAASGKPDGFVALRREARDEEQVFRSIVQRLGWTLPEL